MRTDDAGDVYRHLAPAVLGYLRGQRVDDPEDLLGEVFLHVARSLHRFRGDEEHLRRWVFTIARNRVIDAGRRRARRPHVVGRTPPDVPTAPPPAPLDPDLLNALTELTADQREVVVLRFVADLSLDEVAAVTGRSTGAVKSMQHRALEQLARILTGEGGAEPDDG
jgi:RNA polymerase sigma-70 factor (ECF subfamily)